MRLYCRQNSSDRHEQRGRVSDRQTSIIEAVWQVILVRGITAVSLRSVASAAGVSVGLIQHYYGSKDVLVRASAHAMIEQAAARYSAARESGGDPIDHLVIYAIPTSTRARDAVLVWHAYLAATVADDGLAEVLRTAKRGQERELTRCLAERIDPERAPLSARSLIALADGLAARVITGDLDGGEALEVARAATTQILGQ